MESKTCAPLTVRSSVLAIRYSYLSASIGLARAARQAGRAPGLLPIPGINIAFSQKGLTKARLFISVAA